MRGSQETKHDKRTNDNIAERSKALNDGNKAEKGDENATRRNDTQMQTNYEESEPKRDDATARKQVLVYKQREILRNTNVYGFEDKFRLQIRS